ncbi:RHS repeat-associated core domain-containing protein [Methylocaldum gracile]|uniref:RHS repeat-associated core domain-containing protein n=1 Tax=Methylocaldum sp. 0917 TaxID=2485163 RepID=UPI003D9FC3BC
MALSNAGQQTVNTYAYDPYGRLMATTETVPQPFQYAGQVGVMAEGQNLYYMRARYYDAHIGRFISEDPIGFEGSLNLYAYVEGNPIMAVDPSGLSPAEGARLSQAQIVQFQKDAFDIAIGFAAPISKVGSLVGRVVAKFDPTRVGHIFRDAPGHVNPGTAASQGRFANLFESTASNSANLRVDAVQAGIITQEAANAGVQAFTQTMRNGEQIWVTVRNGVIQNAGINPAGALR